MALIEHYRVTEWEEPDTIVATADGDVPFAEWLQLEKRRMLDTGIVDTYVQEHWDSVKKVAQLALFRRHFVTRENRGTVYAPRGRAKGGFCPACMRFGR